MEHYKNKDLADIKYFCEVDKIEKIEQWLPIEGYEGIYDISTLGRVKSLSRIITCNGYSFQTNEKILSQSLNKKGYPICGITKNKVKKTIVAHVLVAIMFLGHKKYSGKFVVDHIDNIRNNNNYKNLQLLTPRQNATKHTKPTISKYTGVFKGKDKKKYYASICINKINIHLGCFVTEEEASDCYQKALHDWNNNRIVPKGKKRSSKYKNIFFDTNKNKWRAYKIIDSVRTHIGYFNSEQEALNAQLLTPKFILK